MFFRLFFDILNFRSSTGTEDDVVLSCEQIQLLNYQKSKEDRITDQHLRDVGEDGCRELKFNRRDDRRLRKNIERGGAKVYIRRWQLYPEGDPINDRAGKWLFPYAYEDIITEEDRAKIDHFLADFGEQTCTKPIRTDFKGF